VTATVFKLLFLVAALWIAPAFLSLLAADEDTFRVLSPGGSGPHPVVLLVPGCSGFAAINGINVYDERAAELQAAGFAVVYVDYITKRMQSNCAHIGQAEVSADILQAAKWVATQSGVDGSRISVIGWSYGGGGVLAALNATPRDASITKAILYYPVCRGAGSWSAIASGLMLLGAADDIASPTLRNVVTKGASAETLRVITYPNARHGFDMRGNSETQTPGAPAYSPEAASASWTAVMEFLK
jgi:dienelactone hydrolase